MTPYEKLSSYVKLPKDVTLFPIMNLDEITDLIKLYFKISSFYPTGYYLLTHDKKDVVKCSYCDKTISKNASICSYCRCKLK